jgi:hypothetical protein
VIFKGGGVNNYFLTSKNMTPEARLAQVEAILATVAKYIDRHTQAIERNASEIDRLKVKIN